MFGYDSCIIHGMKTLYILLVVATALACDAAVAASVLDPAGERLPLADMGEYAIAVPPGATTQTVFAATQLAHGIKAICGVDVPVGSSRAGRKFAFVFAAKPMDCDQGYEIRVRGGDVVLFGGRRGPLYAVAALFEEDWGVRWFGSDDDGPFFPKRAPDSLSVTPRRYVPPFLCREPCHVTAMGNPAFAVFNRIMPLSYFIDIPDEMGGSMANKYFCHTYAEIVKGRFKDHPEYFPLVDGKRIDGGQHGGQICFTAPGVEDLFVEAFEKEAAAKPMSRIFSVTANDNSSADCQCENCAALIKAEGAAGAQTALANAVARKFAKRHPDAIIDTWGYGRSVVAPKTILCDDNVAVFFAPIANRFGSNIYVKWRDEETIVKQFSAWREKAKMRFIWDYGFERDVLMPNFEIIADNARYWRETGVSGVFLEQCEFCLNSLDRMKTWVYSHLFWNPDLDVRALMDEFVGGYYGAAAPAMRDYVATQMAVYHRLVDNPNRKYAESVAFTDADDERLRAALESALSAAKGDERLSRRVAREYVALLATHMKGCRRKFADRYERDMHQIIALCEKYEVGLRYSPVKPKHVPKNNKEMFDTWRKRLEKVRGAAGKIPRYSEDSFILDEKNCYVKAVKVDDHEALAGKAARETGNDMWGIQWPINEFWASHENQTEYVVRGRVRAELKEGHSPDDVVHSLYIYKHGDRKYMPGADSIRVKDLPKDGKYGFVYFFRLFMNTPSGSGYMWHKTHKLGKDEYLYYDYIELIPAKDFKDKALLQNLKQITL